MPVPSAISDLSQTAGSNFPTGSESPITADNYLRTYASFIALLRDGKGFTNPVTLASATTTDIGGQNSQFVEISGTTTITSFGTAYNGPRFLRFTGALTLTHNATTLNLPGAANITTSAGDTCIAVPNQALNGWNVVSYQYAANASAPFALKGANSDITSLSAITSINGGQLAGLRNRIINGAMKIDQRNSGAAQTITAGAATLAYGIDRWQVRSIGANATVQRTTVSGQNRMQFTGAASVTAVAAHQRIEAANCADMAGKQVMLSLKASSTSLTSLTLEIYYANSTDAFGTWGSPTVTLASTSTATISSTETTIILPTTLNSSITTGLEIRITGGALGAAQTLTIGDVQLEVGSVATPFEQRSYGMELALCQRYYYRTAGNSSSLAMGLVNTTTTSLHVCGFPVTMRTSPTAIEQSGTATDYRVRTAAGTLTTCSGVPTYINATANTAHFQLTVASGLTAGQAAIADSVTANGYLGWSAEL